MNNCTVMRVDVRSVTERWAYWSGEYDEEVLPLLNRLLPDGAVVLDMGANVGFYKTALGRQIQRSGGKLYAFEPLPQNFQRLADVVRLNCLEDTVTLERISKPGQAPLQLQILQVNISPVGSQSRF